MTKSFCAIGFLHEQQRYEGTSPVSISSLLALTDLSGAAAVHSTNTNTQNNSQQQPAVTATRRPLPPAPPQQQCDCAPPQQKRARTIAGPMHDQQQTCGSSRLCSKRQGVAARLKKSLPALAGMPAGSNGHLNGNCVGDGLLCVHSPGGAFDGQPAENGNGACCVPSADTSTATQQAPVDLSHTDRQLVRLIAQHLNNVGLKETVSKLLAESGCQLENTACTQMRQHLMAGEWDLVLTDLTRLQPYLHRPADLSEMQFLVLEQKYLELLEAGRIMEALNVLRYELTPLQQHVERVHQLSALLMSNPAELSATAGWLGSSAEARQNLLARLQAYTPPDVMLPPRRLEVLLEQAMQWQYGQCALHNTPRAKPGQLDASCLYANHHCNQLGFPCETRQILTDHSDEVWCAFFSHNGRYLATGSKESLIYIYEVQPASRTLRKCSQLCGPKTGTAFLAWSPDDKYLAAVGQDGPDLWLFNVQERRLHRKVQQSPEDHLAAVAWHACSTRLVVGGTKGHFFQCDIDGQIADSWEGIRVRSLACRRNGQTVLASDTHNRIRAYEFDQLSDQTLIREEDPLIYFCLDSTEKYALCTTKDQGLHLWDLDSRQLVRRYRGSRHGDYVVVSCFGGEAQKFLASGSEDGNVYIWHQDTEHPIKVLAGHSGVVNAVTWNSADPTMLVSCGDDGTVRVWGPAASAAHPTTGTAVDTQARALNISTFSGSCSSGSDGSLCC